jgi:hypothetical protein
VAVVHALFATIEAADAAARELARNCDEHPSYAVQLHERPVIDPNTLPESATDTGRNTVLAVVVGIAVMGTLGGVAGGVSAIPGLDLVSGAGLGALTGALVGVLSGLMAGTRRPKKVLQELAARLGSGKVLLTAEVDDAHLEMVETLLEDRDATEVGRC